MTSHQHEEQTGQENNAINLAKINKLQATIGSLSLILRTLFLFWVTVPEAELSQYPCA